MDAPATLLCSSPTPWQKGLTVVKVTDLLYISLEGKSFEVGPMFAVAISFYAILHYVLVIKMCRHKWICVIRNSGGEETPCTVPSRV